MAVQGQSNVPSEADAQQTDSEVDAKQGTDKPRGMPVVLLLSTVGAAVALFVVWTVFLAG